jgi:hypothetical protein
MFTDTSRYAKTPTATVALPDGREGPALKLRTLPTPPAQPHAVRDRDQLDVLAHAQTGDGKRFWHVADANTEREAQQLLREVNAIIRLPQS